MQPPLGHVHGYRLDPTEVGALVTSYDDRSDVPEIHRSAAAGIFPVISEVNLWTTRGIPARSRASRPGAKRTAKGEAAVAAGVEQ